MGLRLATSLERFWYQRGFATEGLSWLEHFLARVPARTGPRAQALRDAAGLLELQGELEKAQQYFEESLGLCRENGDTPGTIDALYSLGSLLSGRPSLDWARALLEECIALGDERGNKLGVANALRGLGILAMRDRDYERAIQLLGQSRSRSTELGDRMGVVAALGRLGATARLVGDYGTARTLLGEGIAAARAIGHGPATGTYLASLANLEHCEARYSEAYTYLNESRREVKLPFHAATWLGSFGLLAIAQGAWALGVRLIASAVGRDETLNAMYFPELRIDCDTLLPGARAALGEPAYADAWAQGRAMSLDEAVVDVGRLAALPPAANTGQTARPASDQLTAREVEVLRLYVADLSHQEIGVKLSIAPRTVSTHLTNVFGKIGVSSRLGAARYAAAHGLIAFRSDSRRP